MSPGREGKPRDGAAEPQPGAPVRGHLDPAGEAVYERERTELNLRHVRWAFVLLVPIHLVTVLVYWPDGGLGAGLSDYQTTVCIIHLTVLPCVAVVVGLGWLAERRGWTVVRARSVDGFAALYVIAGALLSSNAQRLNGNLNVFVITMFGTAMLLRQRAVWAITTALVGAAVLVVGVLVVQPETSLRIAALSPSLAVAALTVLLSRFSVASMRGQIAARMTIERQRAELADSHSALETLNRELEDRVVRQVHEIVARASELDKLDQHLRAQVIDRSRQLGQALRQLGSGPARASLEPGDTLDRRIEIAERIGTGAMGEVYRARDQILEREVAVKVLRSDSGVSTGVWARFAAEAEAAAVVRHPAVVPTLHVGISDDGMLYQIQELVDGVTVAATMTGGGRWPSAHAARLAQQVAAALAAAHAAGVVHRDVKPGNIMVTTSPPGVRLLDFGVSKLHRRDADPESAVVGTPAYMAPEQVTDPEATGPACDVYALGVVLHELIAGTPPFQGSTVGVLDDHVHRVPPRLGSDLAPEPGLADLIAACLAKQPAERPGATALAEQLGAIADAAGAPAAHDLPRPPAFDREAAIDSQTVRL